MMHIHIPVSFQVSPFYENEKEIEVVEFSNQIWNDIFFYIDMVYPKTDKIELFPWENPSMVLKDGINLWKNEGFIMLKECFRLRDRKKARPLMIKYLAMYIQLNHWVLGNPVNSLEGLPLKLNEFSFSPINSKERLQFIIDTPDHHHAFTTLNQLYIEFEKKIAIYFLKQNKA